MTHATTPAAPDDTRDDRAGATGDAGDDFGPRGEAPDWHDHWPGWDDDEDAPAADAALDDEDDEDDEEPDDDADEFADADAEFADADDEPTVEEMIADDDLEGGLTAALDAIRRTESAHGVTVTVDLHGRLVDLRFDHAAMRTAAPELAAHVRELTATAGVAAIQDGLAVLRGACPPAVVDLITAQVEAQVAAHAEAQRAATPAPAVPAATQPVRDTRR